MNITYNSGEIPRVCKLHPNISCEECTENCPYIYCQHIDCMLCTERYFCNMCAGNCKKCQFSTYCKICTE